MPYRKRNFGMAFILLKFYAWNDIIPLLKNMMESKESVWLKEFVSINI